MDADRWNPLELISNKSDPKTKSTLVKSKETMEWHSSDLMIR